MKPLFKSLSSREKLKKKESDTVGLLGEKWALIDVIDELNLQDKQKEHLKEFNSLYFSSLNGKYQFHVKRHQFHPLTVFIVQLGVKREICYIPHGAQYGSKEQFIGTVNDCLEIPETVLAIANIFHSPADLMRKQMDAQMDIQAAMHSHPMGMIAENMNAGVLFYIDKDTSNALVKMLFAVFKKFNFLEFSEGEFDGIIDLMVNKVKEMPISEFHSTGLEEDSVRKIKAFGKIFCTCPHDNIIMQDSRYICMECNQTIYWKSESEPILCMPCPECGAVSVDSSSLYTMENGTTRGFCLDCTKVVTLFVGKIGSVVYEHKEENSEKERAGRASFQYSELSGGDSSTVEQNESVGEYIGSRCEQTSGRSDISSDKSEERGNRFSETRGNRSVEERQSWDDASFQRRDIFDKGRQSSKEKGESREEEGRDD